MLQLLESPSARRTLEYYGVKEGNWMRIDLQFSSANIGKKPQGKKVQEAEQAT